MTQQNSIHRHTTGAPAPRSWTGRLLALLASILLLGTLTTSAAAPNWQPPALLDTMAVNAKVRLPGPGAFITADGSMLAAFTNGSIRGVTTITTGPAGLLYMLSIGSDGGGEHMTLKVYDAGTDTIYMIPGVDITFVANGELGASDAPLVYDSAPLPLAVTAASPGTPAGLDSGTVTVAGQVTVSENGTQVFSVTPAGGTPPYTYAWTGGAATASYSFQPAYSTVAHPATSATQQIVCTVTDAATPANTATATWSAVVVNDVDRVQVTPVISGVLPANPTTVSDLTVGYGTPATDADGDTVTLAVVWTKHGTATTVTGTTLPASNTKKGEQWDVAVTASTNPYNTGVVSSPVQSASATIGNAAPTGTAQTVAVTLNSTNYSVQLAGSDPDVDDGLDTLSFACPGTGGSAPSHGTLSGFNAANGTVNYTPDADYLGADSFTFQVSDDAGTTWSALATVTVNVVQEVLFPITVTGAVVAEVQIGTKGGCTDGVDTGNPDFDRPAPPAIENRGHVRLISPLPASPAEPVYLIRDMRLQVLGARFQLEVTPDQDSPVVLSWNPTLIPTDANWHLYKLDVKDGNPVAGTAIDMATTTTLTAATANQQNGPFYYMIATPAPITITAADPAAGSPAASQTITVTGTGFLASTTVKFDTVSAASVTFVSATELTVATPVCTLWQAADITVTNSDGGSATLADGFAFNTAPTANAGGPYTLTLTGSTTLNGSGSDYDEPRGDTLTYAWDLDNAGTFTFKTGQTPSISGLSFGAHTVSLRVTDAKGAVSTNVATATVTVTNTNPVANAGGAYTMDVGGSVVLAGSGTDPDSASGDEITAYAWDLDNAGTFAFATGATPTISGPALTVGEHVLTLRVTDNYQGTGTASTTVTVRPTNAPIARFTMDPQAADRAQMVTFDASTSTHPYPGGVIVAYEWDFDYTAPTFVVRRTGMLAQTFFPQRLTYTIALRVRDAQGHEDLVTHQLPISGNNATPTANAKGPYTATKANGVTLDGTGSDPDTAYGDTLTYAWDLDGNSSFETAGAAPTLTHAQLLGLGLVDGTQRTITLKVTDSFGASNTATATLTMPPGNTNPVAVHGGPYTASKFASVTLAGSGTDADQGDSISAYSWDLDNANTYGFATGATPTVALGALSLGQHTLKLKVQDQNGGSGTASTTLTVVNNPDLDPRAWDFTFDVAFGSEAHLKVGVGPTALDNQGPEDVAAGAALANDGAYTVLWTPGGQALQTSLVNSYTDHPDFSATDQYEAWILQVTAGSHDPCYIMWDSSKVSTLHGMRLFEMQPGAGGTVPALDGPLKMPLNMIDMSTATAFTVDRNQTKYYRIVFGSVTFQLHVETGWNQFSLPIEPFDTRVPEGLPGTYQANTLYGWDTLNYTVQNTLHAVIGYWGYFTAPETKTITGIPVVSNSSNTLVGTEKWQLMGFDRERVLAPNPDVFFPGYSYNPLTKVYETISVGDTVMPGRAYWFYTLRNTMMLFEP